MRKDKIILAVDAEQAEAIYKAVRKHSEHKHPDGLSDLEKQNPAAEKLVSEAKDVFDLAAESLLKEIRGQLSANSK
jgi:hypothetical protein